MRSYYKVCPFCGAHLDPGERCDCSAREPAAERETARTARARPPERAYFRPAVIGVDLASGSDFTAYGPAPGPRK